MDLQKLSSAYAAATAEFYQLANSLTSEQLDQREEDGWSPRQVIHHVADSETQSYARLRRLIAEPGTEIQGYDEGGWGENATLGYHDLPIKPSLYVYQAVRESSWIILGRITEEDLNNACVHSESGLYTLYNWIDVYTRHPVEHAEQIRTILGVL